ncbi:glycosyltransferase [Myceligenerans pegani]|uniref:Glycosyltransferase n=1 Tax=Myceligenerans pegani TaxID=2776917 RepID=A0ABR9N197_9MICO|nr:hypothetical protein [Myceligenerans sp. TRM 65318]MBE1877120.1 hypothetical protein [Myceligenerans sp. TRM 65318]MBE3019391.1 hypothetical protein [Myceligenerans sp. TRM 65318]
MTGVSPFVRRLLARRHVIYVAALAALLVTVLIGGDVPALSAGALFVAVAVVWSAEFQSRAIRRVGSDRERILETQRVVRSVARRLAEQDTALERLRTVAEQGRAAAEASAVATRHAGGDDRRVGGNERRVGGNERPGTPDGQRPRVLFVTSNGSGMGHLTRLLAIARAGDEDFESHFLSLSTAAEIAARRGRPTVYVESQAVSGLSWGEWNRRFASVMREQLRRISPSAVVFDGIQIFRGVHEATAEFGIPLVWVCRGLWKDAVPRDQLRAWRDVAQAVILPAERPLVPDHVASPLGDEDAGLHVVAPIVGVRRSEVLSRTTAIDELGLEEGKKHVLVQLGSGALGSRSDLERAVVDAVTALGADWEPVVFRSPLSAETRGPDGIRTVREYPMSVFLDAFEFSVTSAGYNTVHENLRHGQPAVYVADANMLADDQQLRATRAAEAGLGLVVRRRDEIAAAIRTLSEAGERSRMTARLSEVSADDGARAAARRIAGAIADNRAWKGLRQKTYDPVGEWRS